MNLEYFDKVARLVHVNGIRVSKGGDLIASKDYEDPCRRNIYSATKSVTSLATGIALEEGLLSLEERLVDVFREEVPSGDLGHLPEARVRDLLTMGLGQERSALMGGERAQIPLGTNWVREALRIPFLHHPGERFLYSNVGPYLMGVLIERRASENLADYLLPRLFRPLAIPCPTWERDHEGRSFGAGGLFLSIDEFHRLGLLALQDGKWEGKALVPSSWIHECKKKQIEGGPYSYLYWLGPHGSFRMDGKYGQVSVVFPGKESVVTITAECRDEDTDVLKEAIYGNLYDQL